MRIVSYNVHGFVGRDGRRDPERVAEVLRELDADVVGVQEVDARGGGTGAAHPLERLAARCALASVPGPTIVRPDGDYGNALLTRFPVARVRHHDISVPGREPRGVLEVELNGPRRRILTLVTHLGLGRGERRRQAQRLASLTRSRPETPLVVLGDLNEWWPFGAARRVLRRELGATPSPATFPARLPVLALDRIWCRPASVLRRVAVHRSQLARIASDHLPVVARLELSAP